MCLGSVAPTQEHKQMRCTPSAQAGKAVQTCRAEVIHKLGLVPVIFSGYSLVNDFWLSLCNGLMASVLNYNISPMYGWI